MINRRIESITQEPVTTVAIEIPLAFLITLAIIAISAYRKKRGVKHG